MKKQFWVFGSKLSVLQGAEDTEGRFDLVEGILPVGSRLPFHVHTKYSETFYVVEGEAMVLTDESETLLKAGEHCFIPRNTPHSIFNNSGDKELKALAVASPSGFATLIRSVGLEVMEGETEPSGEHDFQLVQKVLHEIGDEIVAPPQS
ncbi:cupin domain-containing protein [Chryseobacterium sp. T20]|uniref:cupin domain-containing protein n=1 Tax=Chryseobacterium sp. T20 TaxID=3395375 RepID=UPI0039BD2D04